MMDYADILRLSDAIMDGREVVPSWIPWEREQIYQQDDTRLIEYVQALADAWAFILYKKKGSEAHINDFLTWLKDIVSASEASGSTYPIYVTEGYVCALMRANFIEPVSELLSEAIKRSTGDMKTAFEGLLNDCLSVEHISPNK